MAKTSVALRLLRAAAGSNVAEALYVGSEANPRFQRTVDGKLEWGPGSGTAPDTNLYRSAANTLTTDDVFEAKQVIRSLTTSPTAGSFASKVSTDANDRWSMITSGAMSWGDGTGAHDVQLSRSDVETLEIVGNLNVDGILSRSGVEVLLDTFTNFSQDFLAGLTSTDIEAYSSLKENGVLVIVNKELPFSKGGVLTAPYTSPFRYPIEGDWLISKVTATVGTAPTGQALHVDILKNGTTIFTTQTRQPRIAVSTNIASNSAAIEVDTLTTGDYLQVALDQVGSTVAGSDLTVVVYLIRTA